MTNNGKRMRVKAEPKITKDQYDILLADYTALQGKCDNLTGVVRGQRESINKQTETTTNLLKKQRDLEVRRDRVLESLTIENEDLLSRLHRNATRIRALGMGGDEVLKKVYEFAQNHWQKVQAMKPNDGSEE